LNLSFMLHLRAYVQSCIVCLAGAVLVLFSKGLSHEGWRLNWPVQQLHVLRCRHAGACFRCLCTQQLGLGTPVVKFAEFYVSAQAHKSIGGRGTAEQRPPPSDQASPYPVSWLT
jgi:hypothetical protein